ncbi:hypothetical protein OR263_38280 [Streptomyces sp. NEAU-H22]|uniref:hypothetical protein n=1 Tax=Streptomyces sp. NEAU-H22 TaxID=2994655 RepID=UPI0022518450|nr:hypothetical protein [Streptomyces sp. NEAU-H22]MCX3292483.1 hypothetical protein [Streptomyces sp. NEAU-H22]
MGRLARALALRAQILLACAGPELPPIVAVARDLRRQRDGTWHCSFGRLHARPDTEGLITWDVSVDRTVARAHRLR